MNQEIKVGQIWKSKNSYPSVGYYTVEVTWVGYEILTTRFTASEWEDKHWVENQTITKERLLESYELL